MPSSRTRVRPPPPPSRDQESSRNREPSSSSTARVMRSCSSLKYVSVFSRQLVSIGMRDYIQFQLMGFLSADNQNEIKRLFEDLGGDVHVILFTEKESLLFIPGHEQCETCKDTRALLEEVAALSEKIKLEVHEYSADSEVAQAHGI